MLVDDPRLSVFEKGHKEGNGFLEEESYVSFTTMTYIILSKKYEISFPIRFKDGFLCYPDNFTERTKFTKLSNQIQIAYKKHMKKKFIKSLKG